MGVIKELDIKEHDQYTSSVRGCTVEEIRVEANFWTETGQGSSD
jgi:hypothetical protein